MELKALAGYNKVIDNMFHSIVKIMIQHEEEKEKLLGEKEEKIKDYLKRVEQRFRSSYPNYPDLDKDGWSYKQGNPDPYDDWADQPERKAVLITATPKNGDEYHPSQGMNIKYTEEFTFTPDGFTVKRKD